MMQEIGRVKLSVGRRRFLQLAAAGSAGSVLARAVRADAAAAPVKAIAFDAFVTFDPRPVAAVAEAAFPGRGAELSNLWRIRQFEYTWLRVVTGRYADFWQVTEEALVYAANASKLELTAEKRQRLMQAFLELKAWPDVPPALAALRRAGIRLAFLSNMTETMLQSAIRNSGLDGVFEQLLSTDRVKTYKPDPRAYQMGIDELGLKREEIVFAAFGGWDAAGAKSFGYRTFWSNRLDLPAEELGVRPDAIGTTLDALVEFVGRV